MSLLVVGDKDKILAAVFPKYAGRPFTQNDPDLIILDSADLNLGVDNIRELKHQISLKPSLYPLKIGLISQAQKLTVAAQNALLKPLEEPPENSLVILISPNLDFFLPTVLSRCQIIFTESKTLTLSDPEKREAGDILELIKTRNITGGFLWAKKNSDRKTALLAIDRLIISAHQCLLQEDLLQIALIQDLLKAKKYLSANTNVRLTLENLFLS